MKLSNYLRSQVFLLELFSGAFVGAGSSALIAGSQELNGDVVYTSATISGIIAMWCWNLLLAKLSEQRVDVVMSQSQYRLNFFPNESAQSVRFVTQLGKKLFECSIDINSQQGRLIQSLNKDGEVNIVVANGNPLHTMLMNSMEIREYYQAPRADNWLQNLIISFVSMILLDCVLFIGDELLHKSPLQIKTPQLILGISIAAAYVIGTLSTLLKIRPEKMNVETIEQVSSRPNEQTLLLANAGPRAVFSPLELKVNSEFPAGLNVSDEPVLRR